MKIEFDNDKDEVNRTKHGLPLAFGLRVFEADDHVILASIRPEDGEDRFKAVALVDGELHTAVHVWRGSILRLISVRRSNADERRNYDRYSSGPERPRGF